MSPRSRFDSNRRSRLSEGIFSVALAAIHSFQSRTISRRRRRVFISVAASNEQVQIQRSHHTVRRDAETRDPSNELYDRREICKRSSDRIFAKPKSQQGERKPPGADPARP
ncbi:hypothetical protein E4U17_000247 [Claviceps sp. LM77 group G4]|nr:hypothetical protein E4U17_000247 [Claviceps sp. LM77 group G4]KAG6069746.1 hypothetical protein E4U33_004641 [Claviceps sp. LM78 group G4]KAG6073298.1 hypothetical protein E4U16_004762 [Claviceps sp. LM84 group G4]